MNVFDTDFEGILKSTLDEIGGLRVEVDFTGNFEASTPTVWISASEFDLEEEDICPRRYSVTHKIGLVVFSKTDLKVWTQKVFEKIEENRTHTKWEDIKINKVKKVIEGSVIYHYIEVEIIFNDVVTLGTIGNEAKVEIEV